MFRYVLHRRRRMTRTSAPPVAGDRKVRRWRRHLAWAALFTLVASALYFSIAGHATRPDPIEVH